MLNVEIVLSSSNCTMFLRSPLSHPPLFKTGSHSVNQAGLELTVRPVEAAFRVRTVLCLSFPGARTSGVQHCSAQLTCSVFLVCEAALELFERLALPCPLSPDSPAADPLVVGWKPKTQESSLAVGLRGSLPFGVAFAVLDLLEFHRNFRTLCYYYYLHYLGKNLVWRSEDDVKELILSSHPMDSRD